MQVKFLLGYTFKSPSDFYIHTHVYIYIDDIFEHWENLYLKHILDDIIELVLMS